jgi:ATP-binding cassette subfamily B protein
MLEMPRLHFQHDNKIFPKVFSKKIEFCNMGFRYKDSLPWVLRNVNLCVPKGSRVGVIGVTGGGKSTFLDIAMGLLTNSEGNIIVDGVEMNASNRRYWQSHIAHVPQFIYLSDKSVAENIAFGMAREEIDMERVKDAARKAQLSETIELLAQGYETIVGERGIKLSGGQRQRIGIARALYKNASIIFLDEATSALDTTTEAAVMDAVKRLDIGLTIFVVAHRLSTLRGCDFIVEIAGGKLQILNNDSNDAKLLI